MLSWCSHLVDQDGQFLALKGQIEEQELKQIPNDFIIKDTDELKVPNLEGTRHLVTVIKR